MPTYVYACDDCGAQFEQFQRFSDAPITACPRCESSVRRVFQPVGIVFKGSGWYITDSRKSSSGTISSAKSNGAAESQDASTEKPSSEKASSEKPSSEKSSTEKPASGEVKAA